MTEEKFNRYRKMCFKNENDRYIRTYFGIISHYKHKNANLLKENNNRMPENFEKHYIPQDNEQHNLKRRRLYKVRKHDERAL